MTRSAHSTRLENRARPERSASQMQALRSPEAALRRAADRGAPRHADCAVCGSDDVASDEAMHGGLWLLGECGRCGHRWTAGPFEGPLPVPARVRPPGPTPVAATPHAA